MSIYRLFLTFSLIVSVATTAVAQTKYRGVTLANHLRDEDFQNLTSWRVNVARYSIAWHEPANSANAEEYSAWLDAELERLDQVLDVVEAEGYPLVVQLFTPPGGFLEGEPGPALHRVFVERWAQQAFIDSWRKIASRLAGDPRVAAFHLLNEPAQKRVRRGLKNWSSLAQEAVNVVRSYDRNTPIIIDTVYGNPNKIRSLGKIRGKKLIYGCNMYIPQQFVRQGLEGYRKRVRYPTATSNKDVLISRLRSVINFQRKRGANIWIGEFSVPRWTRTRSAASYLRDVISIFETYGWNWTYHSYREADVWDLEMGSNRKDFNRTSRPSRRFRILLRAFRKNRKR